jgi:hypothetical protein
MSFSILSSTYPNKSDPHLIGVKGPAALAQADHRISLCFELLQQRTSLLKVQCVEAFGEPPLDRIEKIAGLLSFGVIAPQPSHAHDHVQFPGFR